MISIRYFGAWLKRFRKRCGYGVHSPFAFNFITGVVFEKGAYYAYKEMDGIYGKSFFWRYSHTCKCLHFLFRLTNYVHPELFVADNKLPQAELAYMQAASRNASWSSWSNWSESVPRKTLFYSIADATALPALLERCALMATPDSALLLRVNSAEVRSHCSEIIQGSEICGVSFDLYDYLLVFFDRSLFKQHYVVNFLD